MYGTRCTSCRLRNYSRPENSISREQPLSHFLCEPFTYGCIIFAVFSLSLSVETIFAKHL